MAPGRWRWIGAVVLLPLLLSGCSFLDIFAIARDATQGRDNNTPGSALARQYLIGRLKPIAQGANTALSGDAAYTQPFTAGTNIVAVIPGTDLASQYVIVGAHYDHLGTTCRTSDPQDTICNGATDNAAGVAALLGIADAIAAQKTPPRRSVVFALWDREEDGLLGSAYYTAHPLVPLASTVGYVNFDIQGANLRPSLHNTTFAVGSETGGSVLQSDVSTAYAASSLDGTLLSAIFGEGRSDYANFIRSSVPTVFFTDSTGPCYHTAQDQIGIVDFNKLQQQTSVALAVTRSLASSTSVPTFTTAPTATYDDAVAFEIVSHRLQADIATFSATDQTTLDKGDADVTAIVNRGRGSFSSADVSTLLTDAAAAVGVLTHGACDGFFGSNRAH